MSYNYNQGGGYGQSNPYGGQSHANPYAQQANPYAQSGANYQTPAQNYASQGQDLEMNQLGGQPGFDDHYAPTQQQPQQHQQQRQGPNILDETRRINEGVDEVERTIVRLEGAQRRALNDTVTDRSSPTIREIDSLNAEIMSQYRNLLDKMKRVKSTPGAGSEINQKHIGVTDRKLQNSRQRFIMVQSDYQKKLRQQTERQYRVARPDATEEEIRQAVEDPNQQVFAQALLNRDRRGESRQVLGAVRDRHEAIQRIERELVELAELFNEMERLVVEQEPMVQRIEEQATDTHDNLQKGNTELVEANKKARAARRKKFICLGIAILIVIIIIVIILIVLAVTHNLGN